MKKIITQDLNSAPESKEILETASKTFAGSKKIYLDGSKPEIKVPMREILQTDSLTAEGKQKNKARELNRKGAGTDSTVKAEDPSTKNTFIVLRGDTVRGKMCTT